MYLRCGDWLINVNYIREVRELEDGIELALNRLPPDDDSDGEPTQYILLSESDVASHPYFRRFYSTPNNPPNSAVNVCDADLRTYGVPIEAESTALPLRPGVKLQAKKIRRG